jgi:lipoprotein-releasing system permease protein
MNTAYEWQVGWRYVRAVRNGRRNGFISFISGVSMLGIALGVAALIIVLSVMNGFSREVRDRMLSVIAHVQLLDARGGALPDWQGTAAQARSNPLVVAAAPFLASQVLLGRGDELRPALLRGIDVELESGVSDLARAQRSGMLAALQPGGRQVVLGIELARQLGVSAGQPVTLVLPDPNNAGGALRMVALNVVGTLEAGHFEYDSGLAWMLLPDAQELFGMVGPNGIQLRLSDRDKAREAAFGLASSLGPDIVVRDWTRTNRQWFESVQIQKQMLFLILVLIVAVAAFNLVATLVMTVTDKRADIAILRTLGASPRSVMAIFMVQGVVAGVIGTAAGVGFGLLVSYNIDVIVPAIERLLHAQLLPSNVYIIDRLPSEPQRGDIVPITVISLLLSFVATIYPSWRASRMQPAEALRHES